MIRIRDHAGTPRRLYPIRQAWHDRARGSQLNPDAAARLRQRLDADRIADLSTTSAVYGLIAAGAGAIALFWVFGRSGWQIASVIVLITAAMSFVGIRFRLWSFRAEVIDAFLRERLCPSCGYDLSGATPGASGLSTCPECSAAWRLPP